MEGVRGKIVVALYCGHDTMLSSYGVKLAMILENRSKGGSTMQEQNAVEVALSPVLQEVADIFEAEEAELADDELQLASDMAEEGKSAEDIVSALRKLMADTLGTWITGRATGKEAWGLKGSSHHFVRFESVRGKKVKFTLICNELGNSLSVQECLADGRTVDADSPMRQVYRDAQKEADHGHTCSKCGHQDTWKEKVAVWGSLVAAIEAGIGVWRKRVRLEASTKPTKKAEKGEKKPTLTLADL